MVKNFFKILFRNMLKNKSHSFINIFGLAMGMTVFFLILMYSLNELSYDKFHPNYKNIYQVEIGSEFYTMAPLGKMIKNNIPDFEKIVRIDYGMGGGRSPLIETVSGGTSKKIKVEDIIFADSAFFNVFNFPAVYGNPSAALNQPYSIVLTRSTAQRLFGIENAVGKTIHYIGDRNSQPQMDMTVTAIVEDVPNNSSITFNAVGSLSTLHVFGRQYGYNIDEDWRNWMYATFVMFKHQDINAFTNKVNKLWYEQEKVLGNTFEKISLIPLNDVHFHHNSKRQLIFLLQLIGVFILVIALINFINLTIAKSAARAREIGIRKVMGSNRITLIKQFLSESILISFTAAPFALMIVELSKPFYFRLIGKQIPFDLLYQPLFILILILSIIIIGALAGIYPALVLSAFKPASVLKGEITRGKRGKSFGYFLIVFQFTVSIALIICTILISKQMNYLKTKDLGFDDKNIIHFNQSQQIGQNYNVFKQKLLQNPNITGVSRSNGTLGRNLPIGSETELNGLKKHFIAATVDPDFIPIMKIKMVDGRPFSWDIKSDYDGAIVVNETFTKEFDMKQPLGTEIEFFNKKLRIIGVMKDFHYTSFHQKVEPAALVWIDWNLLINVRINNRNLSQSIQYIRNVWNQISPETPFEFEFLDQTYSKLYKSDEQFNIIINSFSVIAIILACMGLFGLISQNINRRIKEIGVRKILGATVNSIVFIMIRDLLKWVVLANIIAFPLAWFLMNKWLQNFAYHTEMRLWMFILSGGIALLIAFTTVSFHAIKAATANPVTVLRYE